MNGIYYIDRSMTLTELPAENAVVIAPAVSVQWHLQLQDIVLAKTLHITLQKGAMLEQMIELKNCTGSFAIEYAPENESSVVLQGRILLTDNQTFQLNTVQHHTAPAASSKSCIYAVVQERAKLEYNAQVRIEKSAINTHATQHNKNLLLSPHANVRAKPTLEVLTDAVTCSHGSATEYVDPLQQYTLCSRGLTQQEAKQLLIDAFWKV